eukprot:scaffold15083_cov66-Phaeocystis_antarctica.AAC.4
MERARDASQGLDSAAPTLRTSRSMRAACETFEDGEYPAKRPNGEAAWQPVSLETAGIRATTAASITKWPDPLTRVVVELSAIDP